MAESEKDVLTWIDILEKRPYRDEGERQAGLRQIEAILDGYVATADPPASQLVPELIEIYPEAIVVCTTRDMETWANGMVTITAMVRPRLQRFIFFWMGNLRHLPRMWDLLPKVFAEKYGAQTRTKADAKQVYERHHQWLEEIVPKNKLFYFNVKDGWEPLCKALDVPLFKDIPFPRLNDSKAFEGIFREWAMQGLLRWAAVLGCGVVCFSVLAIWVR